MTKKYLPEYTKRCRIAKKNRVWGMFPKKSWFIPQQRKTYSNLCVLCWLIHLSWFQGPKYIPPSFRPRVTNHDVKSKISKKWIPRSMLVYTTFSWCWAENLKYPWRLYENSGMYNMWAEYFKNSTRSSQSCNFGKIL